MIRGVLDTNVLISIALPRSRLQSLVTAWKRRRLRLLISTEIFDEYLRVLTYPKFQLSSDAIQQILEKDLLPYADVVQVTSRIQAVKEDPSDDKFLACAIDGRADWIISGDRHLLALKKFRGVRIGSPSEFLQTLYRS